MEFKAGIHIILVFLDIAVAEIELSRAVKRISNSLSSCGVSLRK